ncbi:hypothetical protein Nepgr_004168 [Nepenthes gracilis]|uniref:DUF761 domain-containing protein n=1 Tax=Nepenthes gracilis TaxID=150966 RepID=A0AAD3S0X3_NEPGR|nr:hypothetical protein Nepgr_004168 [Nepenthes gracilis]
MGKKKSNATQRAWNLLRLALLRARKGGLLKCRLVAELRLLPRCLKGLKHPSSRSMIRFGERELSFDETPVVHIRMSKPALLRFKMPHIPCINPELDFHYDFDEDEGKMYDNYEARQNLLGNVSDMEGGNDSGVCYEEEGIDARAEEFIANFYEQIKMQRQISHLQYIEMINRGAS